VDTFRATLRKVGALPCDVLISTHPSATGLDEKVAGRVSGGFAPGDAGDPFVNPDGCWMLAERSRKALDGRVAAETKPESRTDSPRR
jgi:metallo-beta-lactamase class B